jgi:hypothetical protein
MMPKPNDENVEALAKSVLSGYRLSGIEQEIVAKALLSLQSIFRDLAYALRHQPELSRDELADALDRDAGNTTNLIPLAGGVYERATDIATEYVDAKQKVVDIERELRKDATKGESNAET